MKLGCDLENASASPVRRGIYPEAAKTDWTTEIMKIELERGVFKGEVNGLCPGTE